MSTIKPSSLLKIALLADAVVSGAVALLQVSASSFLSGFLSVPQPLIFETGVFLVAYTALLVILARSSRILSSIVVVVVLGNIGWALGCVALMAGNTLAPNAFGMIFLAVQAISVVAFAALEWVGLRRSSDVTPVGAGARQAS